MKKRLQPEARRAQILAAAVTIAADKGFDAIKRDRVGRAAGVNGASLYHYFSSIDALRREVVRVAIESENLKAIGRAVVAGYWVDEPLRSKGLAAAFG